MEDPPLNPAVKKLGLLALGETPREDITPTLGAFLGPSVQFLEAGGLDGLSAPELKALEARTGEAVIETRLRSGAPVELSREALLPRLVAAAARLSERCDTLLLLCSGEYPALAAACPRLVQPIHILRGAIQAVAQHRLLGLIGPASDLDDAPAQWSPYAPRMICAAASPYEPVEAAVSAGRRLAEQGAQVIYLDCMGFTEQHRTAVSRSAGLPALSAATLTARVLCEMI